MRQTIKHCEFKFTLGVNKSVSHLTDLGIDQFNRIEHTSTPYSLNKHNPLVGAREGVLIKSSFTCTRRYELPDYWLTATSRWE